MESPKAKHRINATGSDDFDDDDDGGVELFTGGGSRYLEPLDQWSNRPDDSEDPFWTMIQILSVVDGRRLPLFGHRGGLYRLYLRRLQHVEGSDKPTPPAHSSTSTTIESTAPTDPKPSPGESADPRTDNRCVIDHDHDRTAGREQTYTVKSKDTLWGICENSTA